MKSVSIEGCLNSLDFSSALRPVVALWVEPRRTGSKPQFGKPDALELGYKQRK